MKKIKKLIVFCLMLVLASCVKDIDFNQAKNLVLKPTYVASLLTFSFGQTSFFDKVTNSEIIEIKNKYRFSFTDDIDAKGKAEKIILDFEFDNPFNRRFDLEYTFFDVNDNSTYKPVKISVPAKVSKFKYQEEILVSNNPNLFNTSQLITSTKLLPSTDASVINVNIPRELKFTLSGTFYLKVRL